MMDALTVLVLFGFGFFLVKRKLLPRLKKDRQEGTVESTAEAGGVSKGMDSRQLDFRILSFNMGDFTYTEDLAHCVEYELGKAVSELKKEGCYLMNDPFPIVMGSSLLILLYYCRETAAVTAEEVAG